MCRHSSHGGGWEGGVVVGPPSSWWDLLLSAQKRVHVVLLEIQRGVQLYHLERQRKQSLFLQFGKVFCNDLENGFCNLEAGRLVTAMAYFQGHMGERIIVLAISHTPGIETYCAASNAG